MLEAWQWVAFPGFFLFLLGGLVSVMTVDADEGISIASCFAGAIGLGILLYAAIVWGITHLQVVA